MKVGIHSVWPWVDTQYAARPCSVHSTHTHRDAAKTSPSLLGFCQAFVPTVVTGRAFLLSSCPCPILYATPPGERPDPSPPQEAATSPGGQPHSPKLGRPGFLLLARTP